MMDMKMVDASILTFSNNLTCNNLETTLVRDSVTHSQYTVQLKVKLKISTLFFIPNCELWYIVEEWKRCSSLFRNPVGRLSICMPQCQRLICGQSTRRGQPFTIQQTIFPVSSRVIARTLVVLCLQCKKRFMPPKSGAVGFDLWEHNMFEERLDRCHLSAPVKRLKRRKFSSFPQVRRLPPSSSSPSSSSSYFPGACIEKLDVGSVVVGEPD